MLVQAARGGLRRAAAAGAAAVRARRASSYAALGLNDEQRGIYDTYARRPVALPGTKRKKRKKEGRKKERNEDKMVVV